MARLLPPLAQGRHGQSKAHEARVAESMLEIQLTV